MSFELYLSGMCFMAFIVGYCFRHLTQIDRRKEMKKKIEKSENIITAIEFHGCLTGDCPHGTKNECYMDLINIPSLIGDLRK